MADSRTSTGNPPPGWYPDAAGQTRWWDGYQWGQAQQAQQPRAQQAQQQQPRASASTPQNLVFNPPPGWPKPPAGWQPPTGWQPDPSWPDPPANWQFWVPEAAGAAAAGLAGGYFGGGQAGGLPRQPGQGLSGDQVREALGILFPVKDWLHDRDWRQVLRLGVIIYAMLPIIFLWVLQNSTSLSSPGWAYSLLIAPLWGIGFWTLIRPGRIPKTGIWVGVLVVIWTLIWMNVITVNINGLLAKPNQNIPFFGAIGVGINEELTKALPVLLAGLILLHYFQYRLSVQMCMFLGTITGLTFGVDEQASYTSVAIANIHAASAVNQADDAVLQFAERIFVDGLQHAIWAGIAGFFIGMALNYRRRRVPLLILALATPAVLHGLNDWILGTGISFLGWIIIQGFSLLLFLGYTMRSFSIEEHVRSNPIFRGESMLIDASNLSFDKPPPGEPAAS